MLLNVFVERCADADGCSIAVVGQALHRVLYAVKKMCISHCTYLRVLCSPNMSVFNLIRSLCGLKKAWFRDAGAVGRKD